MSALTRRRRAVLRLRRVLAGVNPISVLESWEYDGWGEDGWHATAKSRIAGAVLWKWRVGGALFRALFQSLADDLEDSPWWTRGLYRVKAALCLLAGRHYKGAHYEFDGVQVVWWNGAMTGYYEPEWEDDNLEVGAGWKNWYVILSLRGL